MEYPIIKFINSLFGVPLNIKKRIEMILDAINNIMAKKLISSLYPTISTSTYKTCFNYISSRLSAAGNLLQTFMYLTLI